MKGTLRQEKGIRLRIRQLLGVRPRTVKEIIKQIGCTPNTAYVYLCKMRKDGVIEKQPTTFRLK